MGGWKNISAGRWGLHRWTKDKYELVTVAWSDMEEWASLCFLTCIFHLMNSHDMMVKGFTYTACWGHNLLWSTWRNWWGRDQWPRWSLLSTNQGHSCLKRWSADLWRSSSRPRWRLCSRIWLSPDRLREKRMECVRYFYLLYYLISSLQRSVCVTWLGRWCGLAAVGAQYFDMRGREPALLTLFTTCLESKNTNKGGWWGFNQPSGTWAINYLQILEHAVLPFNQWACLFSCHILPSTGWLFKI